MNIKFSNVVLAVLLSTCVLNPANANLIVGGVYEDNAGLKWKYIGFFDLAAGAYWNDADGDGDDGDSVKTVNGLEAAASWSGLPLENLALAAFVTQNELDAIQTGDAVVNHLAWYDGNIAAISRLVEDQVAGVNYTQYNPSSPTTGGVSAYVDDRAVAYSSGDIDGYYLNQVFTIVVPEPSTVVLFALALCGLAARRFKQQ
jgi:hypothetical protein